MNYLSSLCALLSFIHSFSLQAQETSFHPSAPSEPETIWFENGHLTPCGEVVVSLLQQADQEGLQTDLYQPLLEAIKASQIEKSSLPLNQHLTQALLHYASWISGMRSETTWDALTHLKPQKVDLNHVKSLVCHTNPQMATQLGPQHGPYLRLKRQLQRYLQQKKERKTWPKLSEKTQLNAHISSTDLNTLIQQLEYQGYTIQNQEPFSLKESRSPLRQALRLFQLDHQLDPSGQLTPQTIKALNTSLTQRIAQVQVNLERWRWLPSTFPERAIIVNIPTYELLLLEKGDVVEALSIIVGKTTSQTPSFETCLTAITLNPSWIVPYSIATHDKLPLFQRDPKRAQAYHIRSRETKEVILPSSVDWHSLSKKHFPYTLKLEPGPRNPLGPIKLTIPNPFGILMHGTSQPHLFEQMNRALSWGCIRISNPFKVAAFALNDPQWSVEILKDRASKDRKTCVLKPQSPIPVYITYFTMSVDHQGRPHFAPDLYQKDRSVKEKLVQQLRASAQSFYPLESPENKKG